MKEIKNHFDWINIFDDSLDHPVLIFKHSNTCPISRSAFERVKKGIESDPNILVNLLIVQDHPDLKLEISKDTNTQHESPQVLVIKGKKVILNQTHGEIAWDEISKFFR